MSKFIEVIAIVEGKTEQVFIEKVLAPYLAFKNIFISATQITKPGQKGGDVRFVRAKQDIGNHLKQRGNTFVTTFIDYYGTKEWPGLDSLAPALEPAQISHHLHQATKEAVNALFGNTRSEERFIPYIAMHEFVKCPPIVGHQLLGDFLKIETPFSKNQLYAFNARWHSSERTQSSSVKRTIPTISSSSKRASASLKPDCTPRGKSH